MKSKTVFGLAIGWCINSLAFSIVYPFLPIYLHEERKLEMALVGLIFPAIGLGSILGPPLAGMLVDRFGRSKLLWYSSCWRGMIFFVLALMTIGSAPFWAFAVMMGINSICGSFFQIASDAYLTDITTEAERPQAYSRIRVGTNVGWALGPMIGSFMATTPFSLMFGVTGMLCFGSAVLLTRRCPEMPVRHARPASDFKVTDMLRHREFMLIPVGLSFVLMLLMSQLYSTLSIYAIGTVGISKNWLGIVYSVNGLTVVSFQVLFTRILDKLNVDYYLRMALGAFLYTIGYFGMAFACGPGSMMALVAVLTFGEVIIQPSLYACVGRMAPPHGRGRYMGTLGLMRGVGYALGPYLGALAYQYYAASPLMLWGVLTLPGLLAGFGFIRAWRRRTS